MVASPASALSAERPFPGLRPFAFADHAFFYGRKAQFYDLYNLVDLNRFIAVVGSSGCGKSSLVRAGLLPLLQEESDDSAGRHWRWVEMHPGDAPIEQLSVALNDLARSVTTEGGADLAAARAERIAYCLRGDSSGISAALGEIEGLAGMSLVILVDQFEELFRFAGTAGARSEAVRSREEATHFVQLLLAASRSTTHDVRVLITMRSDFIGDCARFQGLPEAVSETQFLVPSLTRDQREQVIRGPLRQAGASIDSALVERLLNDGQDEDDQLPVLQHCLLRLWEQAGAAPVSPRVSRVDAASLAGETPPAGRHIALAHYESIGGIAQALSRHANDILASLPGLEIAVAQAFRALSEIDKEGRATRRALKLEQLLAETGISRDDLRQVIDRFRSDDCSFLTPSPSTVPELEVQSRIDVGHEALLRRWVRVSGEPGASGEAGDLRAIGWLKEEVKDGRHYQALLSLVESHAASHMTLPLDQVTAHRNWWNERPRTPAWTDRYGGGQARVVRLLEDSEAALAADSARKDLEEEKARQDRLSKARVERLTRIAAVAFFVLFLVAGGFGIWAFAERQHAARANEEAQRNLNIAIKQTNDIAQGVLDGLNMGSISTVLARTLVEQTEKTLDQLKQYEETPPLKIARVRLLLTVSDISYVLRDFDRALDRARTAKQLAQQLVDARDPDGLLLLYASLFRVGDNIAAHEAAGNSRLSLAEYQAAQAIAQQMSREQPDNGDRAYNVAFATNKVGETYQQLGDFARALAEYRAALEVADVIAARPDAKISWQAYPASTVTKIAMALAAKPDPDRDAALTQYNAAIHLQEALVAKGDHDFVTSNLARSHVLKADLLASMSRFREAVDEYDAAIRLAQALADKDPGNASWLSNLASFYSRYGEAEKACDTKAAADKFAKAAEIYDKLAQRDKSSMTLPARVAELQAKSRALKEAPADFSTASVGTAPGCAAPR
jgi:tetratricopeptide (TPR) repeat protein/energy-coupling factor transporter ATP-binding protein EcfA2